MGDSREKYSGVQGLANINRELRLGKEMISGTGINTHIKTVVAMRGRWKSLNRHRVIQCESTSNIHRNIFNKNQKGHRIKTKSMGNQ